MRGVEEFFRQQFITRVGLDSRIVQVALIDQIDSIVVIPRLDERIGDVIVGECHRRQRREQREEKDNRAVVATAPVTTPEDHGCARLLLHEMCSALTSKFPVELCQHRTELCRQ